MWCNWQPFLLISWISPFIHQVHLEKFTCCSQPINIEVSLNETIFINKHILNPNQLRNLEYKRWKSKEWAKWLVERDGCDGQLRRNGYGTLLKGKSISIIIGEPEVILDSIRSSNPVMIMNSLPLATVPEEPRAPQIQEYFTVYHFVRKPLENVHDHFVEYKAYRIQNASFGEPQNEAGKPHRVVQFGRIEVEFEAFEQQDFTVRLNFTIKHFESLSPDAISNSFRSHLLSMLGLSEPTFVNATIQFLCKYPSVIIPKNISKYLEFVRQNNPSLSYNVIVHSIEAVRGDEILKILPGLSTLEKYISFELVNRVFVVAGTLTKFQILSEILNILNGINNVASIVCLSIFVQITVLAIYIVRC